MDGQRLGDEGKYQFGCDGVYIRGYVKEIRQYGIRLLGILDVGLKCLDLIWVVLCEGERVIESLSV